MDYMMTSDRPSGRSLESPRKPLPASCLALTLLACWSMATTLAPRAMAQSGSSSSAPRVHQGVEVGSPVRPYVFTGDLRQLPSVRAWQPGDPIKEIPRRSYPRGGGPRDGTVPTQRAPQLDPLLGLQEDAFGHLKSGTGFLTPIVNFAGQGFSGVNPPDTVGDVGPNYYIQIINHAQGASFTIYDKSGSLVAGPTFLDSLGSGNCASGLGDPVALYDRLAGRWLLSEFSASGNRLCVYVSQTSDPISGGWYNYDFAAPGFPDYPKYAVWPDAYYVTSNEGSPAIYAFDRVNMLAGGVARPYIRMTAPSLAGFGFQALTPGDHDGALSPPASSPLYLARHRDDEVHNAGSNDPVNDFLEIWSFSVDFATPASSSLTGPFNIAIAEFDSDLCGLTSFSCIPQPSGSNPLDPLREVVMWRLQYLNFGSHEALVGNLVTDVTGSDQAGVRWFELRRSGGGSWSLFQEGTYSPDSDHRWMGSAAMDANGNLALGYNVSSSTVHPGLRYAGRLAGDPSGTLPQGEAVLIAGSASNNSFRYGDYSSMNLDPFDDCTFWLTGEYNPAGNWSTRIGAFRFDTCEPCEPAPIADAGADQLICQGDGATVGTTALADTTYSWSPGGETTAQITVMPATTTTYTVTAATACGSAQDSATVFVDSGLGAGLSEDFESGFAGWTASGPWHLVNDSACASPGYGSPVQAMYFGQDASCNYDIGATANGALISPAIFGITAASTLSFNFYREVESFQEGGYDTTEVAVSPLGDPAWTPVWSRDSADISVLAWDSSGPISLAAFAGQAIQVRFHFDSTDNSFNAFTGWLVDDVVVTGSSSCAPVNATPQVTITTPTDGAQALAGATIAFAGTANDAEDGDLSSQLSWSSDLDGALGTGGSINAVLSQGSHTITATVTDSGGEPGSDAITVEALSITVFADGFASGDTNAWSTRVP